MLIDPSKADDLKLDIWREIMRSKGEYVPGSGMMSSVGGGHYTAPQDPVLAASKALNTFNALYPVTTTLTVTKAAKKRARK